MVFWVENWCVVRPKWCFCWWYFNIHIYLGKTKYSSSHFFLLSFFGLKSLTHRQTRLKLRLFELEKHSFQKCSRCSSLICNVLTTLPRNRIQVAWVRCLTHQCPNVALPCNFRWHWPITRCFEDLHSIPWFWDQWPRLWKGGVSWNIGETNLRNLKIWERTTTNLWELFPQLIKQFCLVSWCQTAVPWNLNGSKIKNPSLIAGPAAPCLSGGALHERLVQRLLHQWWPFQSTKSYQIDGRDFPRNRMEGDDHWKSSGKSRHPHENPPLFWWENHHHKVNKKHPVVVHTPVELENNSRSRPKMSKCYPEPELMPLDCPSGRWAPNHWGQSPAEKKKTK